MNDAAQHFLYQPKNKTDLHVQDFLRLLENETDWKTAKRSLVLMKNGKTTRTPRDLHWTHDLLCPDTQQAFHTVYICSKHEKVRELVDHAFDPVITANCKGIIMTANEAATDLFGYTENELVGHSLSLLCGGGHAEHHDEYMAKYQQTGERHVIGNRREVLGRKKDGTEFPCELGVTQVTDVSTGKAFFTGFFKDLTILKKHEAEIQERQDLMQGMINASLDSMLEIDEKGIIRVVNDSACNMFGYSRDEFIGSNVSMICGGGHDKAHQGYMEHYMRTGESRILGRKRQVQARRKDGSEFTVELSVQEVVLASSGKKAFCGFLRDMTLQQHAKRTLRKQREMIHGKFFGSSGGDDNTTPNATSS
jgi:PAS domain S-box-containing protein